MSICTKCDGQGLIGNGPNPHMREGALKTCDQCNGTGQLPNATPADADSDNIIIPEASDPQSTVDPSDVSGD